jgi:hypothetical protein
MTAANKHLINRFKQITSKVADLRHLCSNFDRNRTLIPHDVKQQLERGPMDERIRKTLEKKRNDLMYHVSLVWVHLDDALHVQRGTMGDPPRIR